MRTSYIVFVGALLVSASSYVSGHAGLESFEDLFTNVQHVFGLLGVLGATIAAFFAKSPVDQEGK